MKQYQFTVTSQCIEAPKCAAFVSGSAEIYEAVFSFDSYWDGFARTAVFECGGERRERTGLHHPLLSPPRHRMTAAPNWAQSSIKEEMT